MLQRIGISLDDHLLERFDERIARRGYENRSEAVRDLIREALIEEEWEKTSRDAVGAVLLVYAHEPMDLSQRLTEIQHSEYGIISSSLHVHLDEHHCLEILVLRGPSRKIKDLADHLIAVRGVKHGRFFPTTTAKDLP
ncbi:MAG: nickel-responsive transcriptional regulator NikR [Planctomycetes bacterium]|nr:nickel-responsive transcriptional regulator NikR [Planctomycetota bacterium]